MSPAAAKAAPKAPAAAKTDVPWPGPAPNASLDRVEWRVDGKPSQGSGGPRARFVPYIDSRDVTALLDQWVGPLNWSPKFVEGTIAGKPAMWCHLSIRDPQRPDDWITKPDVGVPTQFQPQKGAVSDAIKRAASIQWGCGRNVYDLPSVWAPCRVTTKQVKGETVQQAWPTEQTLPAILAELKRQGFDVDGGRVAGVDGLTTEHDAPDEPADDEVSPHADRNVERTPAQAARQNRSRRQTGAPAPSSRAPGEWPKTIPGIRGELAKRLDAIEPETARVVAKQAFMRTFGVPTDVKAKDTERAKALVEALAHCTTPQAVAAKAAEMGAGPPESTPADSSPPKSDSGAPAVHEHHVGMLRAAFEDMDVEDVAAMVEATDECDGSDRLVEIMAFQLDDEYPTGISPAELDEWLNG